MEFKPVEVEINHPAAKVNIQDPENVGGDYTTGSKQQMNSQPDLSKQKQIEIAKTQAQQPEETGGYLFNLGDDGKITNN